jgi:hypothetical protein
MNRKSFVSESEIEAAQRVWGDLPQVAIDSLIGLVKRFGISVSLGDVQYMDGRWYITHSGLLQIAHRRRCSGLRTNLLTKFCDSAARRWVFRATVFKSRRSKGFVGYGDADPSNTSSLVRGAEMRVAETRAVNRALRKAYGIGLCSVEELGSQPSSIPPPREGNAVGPPNGNGSSNGQPRLRDRLALVVRKYKLDPNLVKRYAADFCGTESLRDAGRDLVEAFVSTLSFTVLEPRDLAARKISGRLYCTEKSLWRLNWFLRDFGYDTDLLGKDEVDEKALLGLTGVLRTNRKSFAGRIFLNLDAFAPATEWESISKDARDGIVAGGSHDLQLHAD